MLGFPLVTPYMDSSDLQASRSLMAAVGERSCSHISGLLLRPWSPLALMDFRVFSSQSTYRPRRPLG